MKLSEETKRILDGQGGAAKQKALELIVRYARVLDVDELCRVTWADLFCGLHDYLTVVPADDFDTVFSRMSLCTPETVPLQEMDRGCICYSGIEPDCVEVPDRMYLDPARKRLNADHLARFVDSGVMLTGSCTPYLTGFIPLKGEHFVSCESSAVLFMNSLWAARGNGDGIQTSFASAVCGLTPRHGFHLAENRFGDVVVDIQSQPISIHDWDLLGHAVGGRLPSMAKPVLTGKFAPPNSIMLKQFFASLACAAGTEMCHIVGLTPEAPDFKTALGGAKPRAEVAVTADDMTGSLATLSGHGRERIDYVTLGCPHYHIDELRRIAGFLDGKRVADGTTVHLWTSGPIKYLADRAGYTEIIERTGARLLTGSCPSTRGYPPGVKTAAYDSAKQRMSAAQETKAKLFYGSTRQCLETALSGWWEGE